MKPVQWVRDAVASAVNQLGDVQEENIQLKIKLYLAKIETNRLRVALENIAKGGWPRGTETIARAALDPEASD